MMMTSLLAMEMNVMTKMEARMAKETEMMMVAPKGWTQP